MNEADAKLKRLLRAAAQAPDETAATTAPFGFDTRVVAQWREKSVPNGNGLMRLVRRASVVAAAVIVMATAATAFEFKKNWESNSIFNSDFAVVDSTIQEELFQ